MGKVVNQPHAHREADGAAYDAADGEMFYPVQVRFDVGNGRHRGGLTTIIVPVGWIMEEVECLVDQPVHVDAGVDYAGCQRDPPLLSGYGADQEQTDQTDFQLLHRCTNITSI